MSEDSEVGVRVLVHLEDDAEAEILQGFAAREGVEVEKIYVRDLGVTTVIFLLAAPVILVRTIQDFLRWRQDQRLGGYVIDCSGDVPVLRRDPNAAVEFLTIIGRDGSVEARVLQSPDHLADLMGVVLRALTAAPEAPGETPAVTGGSDSGTQ